MTENEHPPPPPPPPPLPLPFYKSVGQLIGLSKPKSHYKLNFAIIAKFLPEPLSICKIKNIKFDLGRLKKIKNYYFLIKT